MAIIQVANLGLGAQRVVNDFVLLLLSIKDNVLCRDAPPGRLYNYNFANQIVGAQRRCAPTTVYSPFALASNLVINTCSSIGLTWLAWVLNLAWAVACMDGSGVPCVI